MNVVFVLCSSEDESSKCYLKYANGKNPLVIVNNVRNYWNPIHRYKKEAKAKSASLIPLSVPKKINIEEAKVILPSFLHNQPTTVVDQFQVRITGRAPGGVNKNEVFNTFPMTSFGSNTF